MADGYGQHFGQEFGLVFWERSYTNRVKITPKLQIVMATSTQITNCGLFQPKHFYCDIYFNLLDLKLQLCHTCRAELLSSLDPDLCCLLDGLVDDDHR